MIHTKALIFDLDGTLVDNMRFQFDAWQRFFSFNNAELTLEEVKRITSVGLPHRIVANFFNKTMKPDEVSAHLDIKESFFQNIYGQHFAPIKGLLEFLKSVARLNIPLALATGSDFRNVNYTLDKLNIRHHFQIIVDADDVRNGKPDPESFCWPPTD